MKFKVLISTPSGKFQHIVRADDALEASRRALKAHPHGEVIETKEMTREVAV